LLPENLRGVVGNGCSVVVNRVGGLVSWDSWVVSLFVFAWPVLAVIVSVSVARVSGVSSWVCGRVRVRVRVSRVAVWVDWSGVGQSCCKKKKETIFF